MPKRKNLVRQVTEKAQGEDSWVEYVPFTMEEKFDETRELPPQDEIKARVKRWNWIGVNDEPLPNPEDDQSVFDKLTTVEMSCLLNVVFGYPSIDDVKN